MTAADGVRVLYRDAHLLALHKPAGLATTAPSGGPCLVEVARALDPEALRLHPSSRLDTETTGVVIFARTRSATRGLLAARRAGAYERIYIALLARVPEPPEGVWDRSIEREPRDPRRRRPGPPDAVGGRWDAKPATTEYALSEQTEQGCVLHVRPRTGRTHQIRVHAAAAGCPLLGDVYYGGARRCTLPDGRVATARRVMLHCARVTIPHPVEGRTLSLSSPAPDDLRGLWSSLGGSDAALDP
jgi:23S rRNA-/tRNA-specific pseudouridylate synthase